MYFLKPLTLFLALFNDDILYCMDYFRNSLYYLGGFIIFVFYKTILF